MSRSPETPAAYGRAGDIGTAITYWWCSRATGTWKWKNFIVVELQLGRIPSETCRSPRETAQPISSCGSHSRFATTPYPAQVLGAVALLTLWIYLSNDPHGPLARFLIGIFPREMKVLGLY